MPDSTLVVPVRYQPVVADPLSSAEQARCKAGVVANGIPADQVTLHDWQDCIGVPWFNDPDARWTGPSSPTGPSTWQHAQPSVALRLPKRPLPAVTVSDVHQTTTSISFHVSRTGVPVLVKTSYFPNWQVSGASGIERSTPNFMVVTPTSRTVRLTYGTTSAEWLGRLLTLVGLLGVGLLVWWGRRLTTGAPNRPVG